MSIKYCNNSIVTYINMLNIFKFTALYQHYIYFNIKKQEIISIIPDFRLSLPEITLIPDIIVSSILAPEITLISSIS